MIKKTDGDFIVLEPKEEILKVGVFTPASGRIHVKAIRAIPIADQPLEVLGRELRELLKEAGTKTTRTYLIIPRSMLIIRYLTIPSERPNEIREMLSLGIHQYIPYESHEVSFDFQVADSRSDGFSKVFLLSALESQISEHLTFAEQAGLDVADVFCSTQAAARAVYDEDQGEDDVRLLVDIDTLSSDVIAHGKSKLKFTRAIAVGVDSREAGVTPEIVREHMASDIKLSVDSFQKEFPNVLLSAVTLSGPDDFVEGLGFRLQDQLGCKVTTAHTKDLPVVWNQGSAMLAPFKEKGISYLSLLGAAFLAGNPEALSFLPMSRRHERIRKHHETEMLTSALALAGALFCVALFFIVNLMWSGGVLNNLEHQVNALEAEARTAEQALDKLRIVGTGFDNKLTLLNMLDELHRRTPEGITLTQLLLEQGSSVKIRGLAKKNHIVSEYLSQLEQSDFFKSVEHMGSQRKIVEREEFFEFTIAANLTRKEL